MLKYIYTLSIPMIYNSLILQVKCIPVRNYDCHQQASYYCVKGWKVVMLEIHL